jgi:integrase
MHQLAPSKLLAHSERRACDKFAHVPVQFSVWTRNRAGECRQTVCRRDPGARRTRAARVPLEVIRADDPDKMLLSYFPLRSLPTSRTTFPAEKRAIDVSRPMGEWKKAWTDSLRLAGLKYRWHDLRHTFVSRLASNPTVSESTLKALSGHVSKRMLEHYSHVHAGAKQAAIKALESLGFDS